MRAFAWVAFLMILGACCGEVCLSCGSEVETGAGQAPLAPEPTERGAIGQEQGEALTPAPGDPSPLDFKLTAIGGQELDLGQFRGRVVLFVNVASRCGFTRQYEGFQRLHERYESEGLVVVGVPSNDFGGQEPGTEAEIAAFCEERFGVTFPMLAKTRVLGEDQSPLYALLSAWEERGPVKWNFEKFLVGRDGQVVERFASRVAPEDPVLIAALERALGPR